MKTEISPVGLARRGIFYTDARRRSDAKARGEQNGFARGNGKTLKKDGKGSRLKTFAALRRLSI